MPSETQNIVLKEYLSENDPQYYAGTSIADSTLKIEGGSRPDSKNYVSNIELYVPAEFKGTINLTTNLGELWVENLTATKFVMKANNGDIRITDSNGDLDCVVLVYKYGVENHRLRTIGGTLAQYTNQPPEAVILSVLHFIGSFPFEDHARPR